MFEDESTMPGAGSAEVSLAVPLKDWQDLCEENKLLESMHQDYKNLLTKYLAAQKKCLSGIKHQQYRMKSIQQFVKKASDVKTHEDEARRSRLVRDMQRREAQLTRMSACYPQESGRYLQIILGSVNVSILDKQAKNDYKDQYERFKLYITVISCLLAFLCLAMDNRLLDMVFLFLCVWYYCTLTIRESILRVNGSRIKGWWRAHHFIATVAGGVILIWPDGFCFRQFRDQLMWFSLYLSFLQYLQFFYQRGCLYKLRSMGERSSDMDITINGFFSWMWKRLAFLLPFLFLGYLFQLYNAYILYHLSYMECATWHVLFLALVFTLMGVGNVITTLSTIPSKFGEKQKGLLRMRFAPLDFWSDSRSDSRANSMSFTTKSSSVQLRPSRDNESASGQPLDRVLRQRHRSSGARMT